MPSLPLSSLREQVGMIIALVLFRMSGIRGWNGIISSSSTFIPTVPYLLDEGMDRGVTT
jgi:hypothetical protein